MDDFSPGMQKILEKIQKLLNLADNNPNEAEASAAAAKAQELLTAYNLETAMLGGVGKSAEDKREEQKIRGGFYEYERRLWRSVAELNFCMYWTTKVQVARPRQRRLADGTIERWETYSMRNAHRMIGRIVNVRSSITMSQYLENAIERLTADFTGGERSQAFSRSAMSFREGMVARLVERISERYWTRVREEQARQAAPGGDTSRALTLLTYIDAETDANNDFIYGAGWSARMRASRAKWEAEARQEREDHERWARENPEEAARQEEEKRKEARKWAKRGAGSRGGTSHLKRVDHSAYYAGRDAGDTVSLDPQLDAETRRRLGRD
jgi:Protein of unknown function (DUF2786)